MRRASNATLKFYQEGGELLLAAAANEAEINRGTASPDALLNVLAQYFCKPHSTLTSGTVCVYRQQARAGIARLVSEGANTDLARRTEADIIASLKARRGTPHPQRGASNKIEVPEKPELSDVFYFLKERFFREIDVQDLILSLYILSIPRLGLRPIEVTWARREGKVLKVATAKRAGHPERDVPLIGWPDEYLLALDLLLSLVPKKLEAMEFKKWRNALASRLARASLHSRKARRLALYCCRHIAFATWREIGMSPEEIRNMAGHADLVSQRSYARGKKGFGPKWLFTDVPEVTGTEDNSLHFTEGGARQGHEVQQLDAEEVGPNETAKSNDLPSIPAKNLVEAARGTSKEFYFEPFPEPTSSTRKAQPIDVREDFERRADAVADAVASYRSRGTTGSENRPNGPLKKHEPLP